MDAFDKDSSIVIGLESVSQNLMHYGELTTKQPTPYVPGSQVDGREPTSHNENWSSHIGLVKRKHMASRKSKLEE